MRSFANLVAWVVVVLMVVGGGRAMGAPLPKVRVAADGRGFETEKGRYVPMGVNYYRPGTGWAPQVWKTFDVEATRKDFARLRAMGFNCVRVFLTFDSFYREPGVLREEGLAKLDQFLALAEEAGIYVHPTGPDHWEGKPAWLGDDRYSNEVVLTALEAFWKQLAARYKGRNVIFAYDLLNEPAVPWKGQSMQRRWDRWVMERYGSAQKAAEAWKMDAALFKDGVFPIPEVEDKALDRRLLDYQNCREDVADEWTRRQAAAIKSADPGALVTVGLIQWSAPIVLPRADVYSGFRPQRQGKFLDFMEIHFYPLESGAYEYGDPIKGQRNLAYVEACVRETARAGKPVVVAEFGWYGGGTMRLGVRQSRPASEAEQAGWCADLIETTAPFACGWLNWGMYDHPQANDVSVLTGLLTVDGKEKAWGKRFGELAAKYAAHRAQGVIGEERPAMPWDVCVTSPRGAGEYREKYIKAFVAEREKK